MSGRLVALCGLPGSGKTTLARRLAESGAVRLCPDEWLVELGVDVFDEPFRARLEGRLRSLAGELAVAGVTVVLEFGFWARVERDELRGLGASLGVPVELRFLDAPLAVLRRRLAARVDGVRIGPELLAEYAGWFVAPDAAELALFAPGVRHDVR